MTKRIKKYYYSINRLYILFFISGILTGLLLYFYTEDNYENKLFEALAFDARRNVVSRNDSDSILLLNGLHVVHNAIKTRSEFFGNVGGIKAGFIQPITVDLMTGQGACGSYSLVMARLLLELNIDARIVQMKVGDVYGGHNIVEARYKNSWIVVDPLYNLFFKRPDGALASFNDVQRNWAYYKQQLPEGYNERYRYEGVRYTNWDKIPVLMPAIKKVLNLFMGEKKADTFSLRIVTLRKFQTFFIITLFFQAITLFYMALYQRRKKKASSPVLQPETMSDAGESKINVVIINPPKTTIATIHKQ